MHLVVQRSISSSEIVQSGNSLAKFTVALSSGQGPIFGGHFNPIWTANSVWELTLKLSVACTLVPSLLIEVHHSTQKTNNQKHTCFKSKWFELFDRYLYTLDIDHPLCFEYSENKTRDHKDPISYLSRAQSIYHTC